MIDPLDIERVGKLTTRVTPEQFNAQLERERYTLEKLALEALRSQVRDQRQDKNRAGFAPVYPSDREHYPAADSYKKRSRP